MSEFEYLRYVTLGQYIPTGSPIHCMDPRARLVGALFLLAALTLSRNLSGLLAGLAIVMLLLVLARIPLGFALRSLLPPLPFLAILALLQILFPVQRGVEAALLHFGWVQITWGSILAGVILLVRFAGLILTLSLTSYAISSTELIHGFESLLSPLSRMGIPTRDLVMAIQVMLRFIPFLAQAAERIAKAQASRGASWGTRSGGLLNRVRQVVPLIVPLFLTGLRRAENLALAMEARGYGTPGRHSSMLAMQFRLRDALAILVCVGLAVIIVSI
ncbi:MAG: energy-coupling factor transporter transmembrane component T [Anaerolineaceae bacterium]|nr:energy-coupling factor transporter transmembrane component T [Anaerolineaceae bacterium]